MKKLKLFFTVFFLITAFSVFGQGGGSYSSSDGKNFNDLYQDNIYGDYFLFAAEQSVSLDLEDAHLVDVLKMLSQQTGLNFISTEAVRDRKITLYIQDVPLKQAMDIIFNANNLNYNFYPESKMFVVKEMGRPSLELKTKVYHLKYARVLNSVMQREIDQILENIKKGGADSDVSGSGGTNSAGEKAGIKEVIEQALSESGRVVANQPTNSLVVIDVPSQFPIIDDLVARLDTPPQKVMIEVEILDVSKDAIDKIGIKHDGIVRSGISSLFTPFPSTFSPDKGPIPWRTSTVDLTDINIVAQLYKQDTTAKILARPRIMTLNNETAEIDVVTDEVIGTKVEYDGDGNIQSSEAQRISDIGGYKGSGVTLRVTPQINPLTNEITLIVYPSVVDTSDSTFTDENGNVYRNIEDRSTRSVVRLDEGETLLLGGLIKNDKKEIITKVPFFGDIPLLGALFRHKDTTGTGDRELLVFLTPKLLGGRNLLAKKENSINLLKREQADPVHKTSVTSSLDHFSKTRRD